MRGLASRAEGTVGTSTWAGAGLAVRLDSRGGGKQHAGPRKQRSCPDTRRCWLNRATAGCTVFYVPQVSVVITTYNRPEMLANALRSVQGQSFSDLEILVCDDASGPSTGSVVAAAGETDSRVRHLRSNERLGQRSTALRGLEEAGGEFVAFCDDDDAWEPQFLTRTTGVMQRQPGVATAFSDHWIMNAAGNVDFAATEESTRRWKRDALSPGLHQPFKRLAVVDQAISAAASLYRRSAIDLREFPEPVGRRHDLWLCYLLSRDGGAAWYIPERLTRYRVHDGSATAGASVELARSLVYVRERMLADDRLSCLRPALVTKLSISYYELGICLLRGGDRSGAQQAFRTSLKLRPALRPSAGWILSICPPMVGRVATRR